MKTKVPKKEIDRRRRGDIMLVQQLTKQGGLNGGGGYSYDYVKEQMNSENPTNKEIMATYEKVLAMRRSLFITTKRTRS